MHLSVVIGLALALACAVGTNLGGLWKQKGALQVDDVDIRHPVRTAVALFRSKWFAIGWGVAAIGWLLHIGALALAPLSLAQAVISGGLVLLGVLAERFFGFKLNRRQWIGLGLVSLGLALLAATAKSDKNHSGYAIVAIAAFEGISLGLGAALVLTCRIERLRESHGVLLGAAAGLMFGVSDVSIKAATGGSHGGMISPWPVVGVVAGVAAFYASARSFQIGDGVSVIAATAAAANLLGMLGGVVVFGEPLGSGALTVGGRVTAFLLVVISISLLPTPVRAERALRVESEEAPGKRLERELRSAAPA